MVSEVSKKKSQEAMGKFTRRQVMELDTCAHCALCTNNCPIYVQSKKPNHAPGVRASMAVKLYNKLHDLRARIFGARTFTKEEVDQLSDSAFNCTLCGRCMEVCPFGLQTHELWSRVREVIHDLESNPSNVSKLEELLDKNQNPYGLESDMRLDWADYTDLEDIPEKDTADIAYFVGCTTAFKGANHEIAFSMASILNKLEEDWTLIGEEEWCCGSPSLLAGDETTAQKFAEHNVKVIESKNINRVITGCSGCFRVFKWEYPKLLGKKLNFEITHSVQYLTEKLKSGELKPEPNEKRVAYHDPCELSRLGGIIDDPRTALKYLTKDYVELPEHGMDVHCCGGGGLLQASNNEIRIAIAQKRLKQVEELSAEILTSACPACKLAFIDAVRAADSNIEILDLIELAARQLDLL